MVKKKDKQGGKKPMSRRKFLVRGAIILGGAMAATYAGRGPIRRFLAQTIEGLDPPAMVSSFKPHFWFEVLADNTILLKSPKVEMGQGIFTGFAMLAAEELEVSLEQMRVEHANTDTGPVDNLGTGGSNSTSSLFVPIREVAATMREMLKNAAADAWGVSASQIEVQNGVMRSGNKTMTYAEAAASTTNWKIPKTPKLKPASEFKYIGTEVPRIDLAPKVLGKPIFGIDGHIPGMLYGVILQTPYIGGKLKSANIADAKNHPGVVQIVREKDWLAVVAESRFAAETALRLIDAEWDVPRYWQLTDLEDLVTVGRGNSINVQKVGRAEAMIAKGEGRVFRQEYRTPIGAHAQMEPNGAVIHVEEDKARVIMGTQAPGPVQQMVAKALGMKKDKVLFEPAFVGGGFGRRMKYNTSQEVALIARAVGKPVHVFNTREQEFLNSNYRPHTHHVLHALIDDDGNVQAITRDLATPDMAIVENAGELVLKIAGADIISAGHGAAIMYNVPNKSTAVWHCEYPLVGGIWRSVGMFANCFAVEAFMNELAMEVGKDPITLRKELLAGPDKINRRYISVLETLEEKSGWRQAAPEGVGRGMAIGDDRKSIAAAVVEVKMTVEGIRVTKVTHVSDAGLCINPDGVRMQVESCIMMGISAALYEEIDVKDGQIASSNFHAYKLASLKDTPEMDIILVQGDEAPYGVGEPPLAPIAPAITAAVYDLTKQHIRSLPVNKFLRG